MNKIPLHKLSDAFHGEIAFLRYISEDDKLPKVGYAHKDDYYVFLFLERGTGWMAIDFEEYEFKGSAVHCVLPGQVHFPIGSIQICGWMLAVDSVLVKEEYKEVFEKFSLLKSKPQLEEEQVKELRNCITAIQKRFIPDRTHLQEMILRDLFYYFIGMIAEVYQNGALILANNRFADITYQFKMILSDHYQTMKRPSQYASLLNLSPVYLNEAVKKTTGLSVSECIQNEIILQAKRLLYYTNLSIKEIAQELGYEDYAYFTRLFTKIASTSPTQFRKRYLK